MAAVPARDSASPSRHQARARGGHREGRGDRRTARARARRRAHGRALRARSGNAELRRARRRRQGGFCRARRGQHVCAVLVGSPAVSARRNRRSGRAISARRHAVGIHAQGVRAIRARRARGPCARSRIRPSPCRTTRKRRLGGRFRRAAISRSDPADAPHGSRRSCVRLRARDGQHRRLVVPSASCRRRQCADRSRAFRSRAGIVRAALSRAAKRERGDRARGEPRCRVSSTASAAACSASVAAAPPLPAVASGGAGRIRRRRPDGRCVARQRAGRLVRLRHGAVGRALLAARGRSGGRRRRSPAAFSTASCSWRRKVFPAVRFPTIRSCGGCGRAKPRPPPRCSGARWAVISSCPSRSDSSPRSIT